jgi:hypothetical protein
MSYKRVVEKRGKSYGPYVYESYRDKDGKVKKRYLGKASRKTSSLKYFYFAVAVLAFFLFLIIGYSTFFNGQGNGNEESFAQFIGRLTGLSVLDDTSFDSEKFSASKESEEKIDSGVYSGRDSTSGQEEEGTDAKENDVLGSDEKILGEEYGSDESGDSADDKEDTIDDDLTEDEDKVTEDEDVTEDKKNESSNLTDIIDEDILGIIDGNLTEDNNLTEEVGANLTEEFEFSVYNSGIVINKPVRWIKSVRVDKNISEKIVLEIPRDAENVQ